MSKQLSSKAGNMRAHIETLESRQLLSGTGASSVLIGNTLYFVDTDTGGNTGLYKSDANGDNKTLIKESPHDFFHPTWLTNWHGTLFFSAKSYPVDYYGDEVWKSDGTAEGTQLVKDIVGGHRGSNPHDFVIVNDHLLFLGETNSYFTEVFVTDGTVDGTLQLIVPENLEGRDGSVSDVRIVADRLYADINYTGQYERWVTDGTLAGTMIAPAQAIIDSRGLLNITGTNGNDTITVTSAGGITTVTSNSLVQTFDNDDFTNITINVLDGEDNVQLDETVTRNATIWGKQGIADTGTDTIHGGAGNDYIVGAGELSGGGGNDQIAAIRASQIDGGDGNDKLIGSPENDEIDGGNGNDSINGGDGNDLLSGGVGDDTLLAYQGDDTLDGGDGRDLLLSDGGDLLHSDSQDFGANLNGGLLRVTGTADGNDHILVRKDSSLPPMISVAINGQGMAYPIAYVGNIQIDGRGGNDLIQIQNLSISARLYGGTGDDSLFGSDAADRIYGGDGNDWIDAGAGNDTVYGEAGNDRLFGGDGKDYINGGGGIDLIRGGAGRDHLVVKRTDDYRGNQGDIIELLNI